MTMRRNSDRATVFGIIALRSRVILFSAVLCAFFCLSAGSASAAGTPAGSIISNAATVTYIDSGASYTKTSNITTLVVDDKVNLTLTSADVTNVTITPGGRAYMTYILSNSGNAPHDYTLTTAVSGSPTLSPASGPVFYADAAGTIPLPTDPNAGGLPYISNLGPDAALTVYMYITAPLQLQDGETIAYIVTAESWQPGNLGTINPPVSSATKGAVDATIDKNAHQMTQYVVLADAHGNGGDLNRDGKYATIAQDGNGATISFKGQAALLNIVKAVTVTDTSGGSQPMSGATLRYTLSVSATGSGSALGVVITDPIPASTTYKANTLTLNGTSLSDASDSDAGDVGGTTAGFLTVKLGDMISSTTVQTISFEVKID